MIIASNRCLCMPVARCTYVIDGVVDLLRPCCLGGVGGYHRLVCDMPAKADAAMFSMGTTLLYSLTFFLFNY